MFLLRFHMLVGLAPLEFKQKERLFKLNMNINYYDAFIPSVTFNKNYRKNLKQNKATIHKYPIEKKKNFWQRPHQK